MSRNNVIVVPSNSGSKKLVNMIKIISMRIGLSEYDEDYLKDKSVLETFKIHFKNWMIFPKIHPTSRENNWIYENEGGDPSEKQEKFWSFSVLRAGLLGVFLFVVR